MFVGGVVRVPGDKSISHRALMLAALAPGRSEVRGVLTSLDVRATARVLRQLGADLSRLTTGSVTVRGRRSLRPPTATLHCGNAGTTARLITGILAPQRFTARLSGDASLRRRPMRRVTEPLTRMGARFDPVLADRLPYRLSGGPLEALRWDLPVSSAQLKSALLLAGAVGGVPVSLREPDGLSRDHTERMLRSLGFGIASRRGRIELGDDGGSFRPLDLDVPGDPSSAAFLVAAALMAEGGTLALQGVGLNPTRIGFVHVLERMGARLATTDLHDQCGEPAGTLHVRPSPLVGTVVSAGEIPGLVDEVPVLAALASRASGTTRFCSVGELRVKESDRLGLLASNLRALGGHAEVQGDDLVVEGVERPPRGRVVTENDHRLAMAFAVLGTVPGARIVVDNPSSADVSFPGFGMLLRSIRRNR